MAKQGGVIEDPIIRTPGQEEVLNPNIPPVEEPIEEPIEGEPEPEEEEEGE